MSSSIPATVPSDFTLPGTGGDFTLAELARAGQAVVVYFYPKDSTPGCTTEAAQFRDLHPQFAAAGAVIVGISRDSLKSHANFKAKLDRAGIPATYNFRNTGTHSWPHWIADLKDSWPVFERAFNK